MPMVILILDSIFQKLVVAAFITFMTFVVFAGICILLLPKLLQLFLLAVDLTIAILFILILHSRTSCNFNISKIVWQG